MFKKLRCTSKSCQLSDERIKKESERQKLDKLQKDSYNKENKQNTKGNQS